MLSCCRACRSTGGILQGLCTKVIEMISYLGWTLPGPELWKHTGHPGALHVGSMAYRALQLQAVFIVLASKYSMYDASSNTWPCIFPVQSTYRPTMITFETAAPGATGILFARSFYFVFCADCLPSLFVRVDGTVWLVLLIFFLQLQGVK